MTSADVARVRASFENAEEILPIVDLQYRGRAPVKSSLGSLPQMPQLPQPKASACRVIADEEDEFEERAAIIEYDGRMPRPLAEFLARRGRGQ